MKEFTNRDFLYSLIPGLEEDLKKAKEFLDATKELDEDSDIQV